MSVLLAATAAAQPIGFIDYLTKQLNLPTLEELGKRLVTYAESNIPGADGAAKKKWCVDQGITVLKAFANYIPILSEWVKVPMAEWLIEWAVAQLVEWAWAIVFGVVAPPTPKAESKI